MKLPPLQQTVLDPATAEALFRDLAACTQILSVTPKTRSVGHTRGAITIDEARVGLLSGELHGAQIRYRYDDAEWCDTLFATPQGLRVVRIRTDDIAATLAG
jgi:hypothetical protein